MPESYVQVPPQSTGLKLHTRQRTVGANTVEDQFVIPIQDRVVSGRVLASTFRIPGLTTTPHNLFTIENGAASAVLVGLRSLWLEAIGSAASVLLPTFRFFKGTTTPSGGTASTKSLFDSAGASDANVVARGAASADGTASAITYALPAGTPAWQTFWTPMVTSGVYPSIPYPLIPEVCRDDPVIIRPGQSILVAVVTAAVITNHYLVNAMWDEFTLP